MQRARFIVLAGWLLFLTTLAPIAAAQTRHPVIAAPAPPAEVLPLPEAPETAASLWNRYVTPQRIVQGAGALLGFLAFNLYVAPLSAAPGVDPNSVRALLGNRVVGSTLAAVGAVATSYAYDRWTDQPIDYGYFWSRGGAVVGVAAGSALLAAFGFPPSSALVRFSPGWVANRSFLIGSALFGAWATDAWVRRNEPVSVK